MKIRHGFVTNSSSSSFVLLIKIEKTDGKIIEFKGNGGSPECGRIDYFDNDANVTVSPRQLGKAKSVENMIELLTDGVIDGGGWEDERKIFEYSEEMKRFMRGEITEIDEADMCDAYEFIEAIRENIKSMDEIATIMIAGEEYNYIDYIQHYMYDRRSDKYTGYVEGHEFEKDGVSGGNIMFSDFSYCEIITEDEE